MRGKSQSVKAGKTYTESARRKWGSCYSNIQRQLPILIAQRCSSNFVTSPNGRLCLSIACSPGRGLEPLGPGGGL